MWNLSVHRINPNGAIISTPKFLEWVMCMGSIFIESTQMGQFCENEPTHP
jgi:hypothetical protein